LFSYILTPAAKDCAKTPALTSTDSPPALVVLSLKSKFLRASRAVMFPWPPLISSTVSACIPIIVYYFRRDIWAVSSREKPAGREMSARFFGFIVMLPIARFL
jgi:hypothetical protein